MALLAILAAATATAQPVAADDVILRAMQDELQRSRKLTLPGLDSPYYVEYTIDDVQAFSASAILGALLGVNDSRFRVPRVRVRVGDYFFDNTNYIYTDLFSGSRYDSEQLPLDNDYAALRRGLWLASDRGYKTAVEAIARKRAALKNVTQVDTLQDFWKAAPLQRVLSADRRPAAGGQWPEVVKRLSAVFLAYPEALTSAVAMNATRSVYYMHNTEGTLLRHPEPLAHLQATAAGQAPDGMAVRDSVSIPRIDERSLPPEDVLKKAITAVGENVRALAKASVGEAYAGPVLFEGIAGAQIMAELLAPNLALARRPLGEPGRPVPFFPSELEGRLEARVLPDYVDVIDDPLQKTWKGDPLLGGFDVDEEGVAAKPIQLVQKGRLKDFLRTRQPVKGFTGSNGRARMPGPFGARSASISNLFVQASETVPASEMRKKLLEMVQARNKPYGIIVRKMDFPSGASSDEVRRIMTSAGQGGGTRPVSAPVLVYRVYPDGREELVRGLRFRGLSVRSLKDIVAMSDEQHALHYLNNLAPFALLGAGGYVAPASVIAPALLFEDLELERPQEDQPKLPIVPPPPLTAYAPARH